MGFRQNDSRLSRATAPRHLPWRPPATLAQYLGVACGLLLLSCSTSSDEKCGCYVPDVVDFTFAPAITEAGKYTVTLSSPPVSGVCEVVVGASSLEPCSSAHLIVFGLTDEGVVALSGLNVWFDYASPTVELTLSRDGETLVDESYSPNYVRESPEGGDCNSRLRADIEVELP